MLIQKIWLLASTAGFGFPKPAVFLIRARTALVFGSILIWQERKLSQLTALISLRFDTPKAYLVFNAFLFWVHFAHGSRTVNMDPINWVFSAFRLWVHLAHLALCPVIFIIRASSVPFDFGCISHVTFNGPEISWNPVSSVPFGFGCISHPWSRSS